MRLYGVLGNPIEHSLSPVIHQYFAESVGIELSYEKILVPLGEFNQRAASLLLEQNYGGLNVTLPFKIEAAQLAEQRSAAVECCGAANTLYVEDGKICADNTDGKGIVRDITCNHNTSLQDARILLVGAGGAVRGVLPALMQCGLSEITVVNRTQSRAVELAQIFSTVSVPVHAAEWNVEGPFDVVINATSSGTGGGGLGLSEAVFQGCKLSYDMMYGKETEFLAAARHSTAGSSMVISDGLGMLVEQAAESFYIWTGQRPQTQPVLLHLRDVLKANVK